MKTAKEIMIYDNDCYFEDYRQNYIDYCEENNIKTDQLTKHELNNRIVDYMNDDIAMYWDVAKYELEHQLRFPLLLTGTGQTWRGYYDINYVCYNFNDFISKIANYDFIQIYKKGKSLHINLIHHDGTHRIEIKQLSSKGQKQYDNTKIISTKSYNWKQINFNY